MSQGPLVSIIMNGHNAETYLHEAINSVFDQSYKNWEIIFWDNCSSDETANIVASYSDSRVRYFISDVFTSLGEARNRAISQCRGELIAFLDCDDIWLSSKLEKQVPAFENEEIGLIYSDSIYFNQAGESFNLFSRRTPSSGKCFKQLLLNYSIPLQTAVIRTGALKTLDQYFDPQFNLIEEFDLFIRLARHWEVGFINEALAKWRIHENSLSWTQREGFAEERVVFLEKLKHLYDFSGDDTNFIQDVENKFAYDDAMQLWQNGKGVVARTRLRNAPSWRIQNIYLMVASFFPYKLVKKIISPFMKLVRPN